MSQVVRVVAACAAGVLACGVALAGVESFSTPIGATIQANSGEVNFEYVLPLFNTQGGTRMLTDVQISGTAIITADTQVTNTDTFLASFTVQYAGGISGLLPGGIFSAFQSSSQSELALFPAATRPFQFVLEAPISGVVSNVSAYASPTGGALMQTGTFTAGLTLPPLSSLSWNPGRLQLGGFLEMQYSYQIVPAPGAAALLGLGALVATRRRR